jgi:hypothetical protein
VGAWPPAAKEFLQKKKKKIKILPLIFFIFLVLAPPKVFFLNLAPQCLKPGSAPARVNDFFFFFLIMNLIYMGFIFFLKKRAFLGGLNPIFELNAFVNCNRKIQIEL